MKYRLLLEKLNKIPLLKELISLFKDLLIDKKIMEICLMVLAKIKIRLINLNSKNKYCRKIFKILCMKNRLFKINKIRKKDNLINKIMPKLTC